MMIRRRAICAILFLASFSFVSASTYTPDPSLSNPDRRTQLYQISRRYLDANFDPDANLVGASSLTPPNKKLHSTGASMGYVNVLLMTGDPDDQKRAVAILANVLKTQDTDPASPTCGVFGWYTEQHATDPNAAEFIGLGLAGVIDRDRAKPFLDPDLRKKTEQAFRLAVDACLRRNVDAGYSNIALLSTALAAAGQKLFSIPKTDTFAADKLDAVTALTGDGEFSEYCSPTYYGVCLTGLYSAKHFAFSDAFGSKVDAALDHLWKQIALDYHAPTFQLAGPFARSYGDSMFDYAAALKYWLALALPDGYPLPDTETEHDWDKSGAAGPADLPISPLSVFKDTPPASRQWDAVNSPKFVRHLSQFRDGNFILSTVAGQDEWKQKRNLVAYWRNDGPPPYNLSVGYCVDESNETLPDNTPFGQFHFYCQQKNNAALVVLVAPSSVAPKGGSSLVFDSGAKVADVTATPLTVTDGTITTYIFPITTATVPYAAEVDTKAGKVRVNRPWSSADSVGSRSVLAYLAVFRTADQPAPSISDAKLKADNDSVTASASIDGTPFSLSGLR